MGKCGLVDCLKRVLFIVVVVIDWIKFLPEDKLGKYSAQGFTKVFLKHDFY